MSHPKTTNKYDQHNPDILLIEKDLIRKLKVRRNNVVDKSTILTEKEFDQIKKNSNVLKDLETVKCDEINTDALLDQERKRQENLKREIENLKESRIPDELDEEEERQRELILARTEQMKREQEDIIKRCNSLILSVKCKVIQDAQITEKETINTRFKQFENSIDNKLEEERQEAMREYQRKREREWADKRKYAESILSQIREHESLRSEQMKHLQREFKLLKLKADQQMNEESQKSRRNSNFRLEIKKQNERINEQIKREKKQKQEQEKLENIKIQTLVRSKLKEEREMDKQNKKMKQLQERELARLWKMQKDCASLQELREDLMTERIQEKLLRKWRTQELETARKKKREIEELKTARDQQICQKRSAQISVIEEKQREAEKTTKEFEILKNELLHLKNSHKQETDKLKKALQEQISERKLEKRKQQDSELREREEFEKQMRHHQENLRDSIKKKIDEMKARNVPNSYIIHLQRQIDLLK